jgi:DNA repair ATPase RecN
LTKSIRESVGQLPQPWERLRCSVRSIAFCITHLPQVASQPEHHLLVEKGLESQRTSTSVRALKGIGREEEIARMLGGLTITKKVRETAAELIAGAKGKRSE